MIECALHKEVEMFSFVSGWLDACDTETETLQGQMIQELQGLLQSIDLSSYLWKPKPKKEFKQISNPFLF